MRVKEYAQAGVIARWLEPSKARNAYEYVLRYSHPRRYGLNEESVANVERLIIKSYSIADAWLKEHFPMSGTVQIVYSESEVAVVESESFLQRWQDIFVPAQDDAIVLHNLSSTVLFYCHEEELEISQRKDLAL